MSHSRDGLRIAMWSGPRNISTAMMRAWENRTDIVVIDEPFYAHYLLATGVRHPGCDNVLAAQSTDAAAVAAMLTGPIPGGRPLWYQKHMTQHMLPDMPPVELGSFQRSLAEQARPHYDRLAPHRLAARSAPTGL